MNRQQRRKMKGYILPRPWYNKSGTDFVLQMSIYYYIAKEINNVQATMLEDIIVEVWMKLWEKDKFYTPALFRREVIKIYVRRQNTHNGMTQRGTLPEGGKNFHIGNIYDEHGNNMIEQMGYTEDGELFTGMEEK